MDRKEYLEEIKNQISIENMENLLAELGGEPQVQDNIIKCRTICHGGDSHKLYYYHNTKLFKCYTQCEEDSFDIFQLLIKVKPNFNLPQAVYYIINFFNLATENEFELKEDEDFKDWAILNNYTDTQKIETQIIEMKTYDEAVLKYLPQPRIVGWENEGIAAAIMQQNNICYNPITQGIIIPHYNVNNQLVGIRERTLIKENEQYGKYRPAILGGKMYNHPLGFNLYNLNKSKNAISKMKIAIVLEGEKSTLKYASFFGAENDITVAVCGSSITMYQFKLLYDLGINELVIGFDKQFQEIGDEEYHRWIKKLKALSNKFQTYCKISFLFDTHNLLKYKDSPVDQGPEVFLELFKHRLDQDGKE